MFGIALFFSGILFAKVELIIPDYSNANKNIKQYPAVPTAPVIIIAKAQAVEPVNIFEKESRGRGWLEAYQNEFANQLRNQSFEVYVDYFTTAKTNFYAENPNYEICYTDSFSKELFDKNVKAMGTQKDKITGKYNLYSATMLLVPPLFQFAVIPSKLDYVKKYKFPGTEIYNLKSLIDDPDLYTAHAIGMASGILQYTYFDYMTPYLRVKTQYKRRIYDFVASNAFQITLMLKAKRMHWVDMYIYGDFFAKKLGYTDKDIVFLEYAHKHPGKLLDNDIGLFWMSCFGKDIAKLKKIVHIMNERIKKIRTNRDFWNKVMEDYSKHLKIPYESPDHFYWIKENFKRKIDLDNGNFDHHEY